jgi:hypothetical protein
MYLINKKVPTEEKLELVYKFFRETWHTKLIKDDRPEPPTVEQMRNNIDNATFPAMKLLDLEDWWHKARLFYYMGGDESMLHMEGDPDYREAEREFLEFLEEEAILDKALKEKNEEVIQFYEKKRNCQFFRNT